MAGNKDSRLQRKNGIKSIRKLSEQGLKDGEFWKPDAAYAEQVYNLLNRTVFNGQLTRPKLVIRNYKKNFWGECEGTKVGGKHVCKVIRLHRCLRSSKMFIRIMAHEMVHQWEYEKGPYNKMTHGKRTFYSWKPECARWGITLS